MKNDPWQYGGQMSAILVVALSGVISTCNLQAQVSDPAGSSPDPLLHLRGEGVPIFRSDTRLVTLDVIVADDKGRTIQGLLPSNFTLRENGVVQTLTSVEEHKRPDQATNAKLLEDSRLPPNTFSDYPSAVQESSAMLLVLDALDSPDVRSQMMVREEMLAYMKTVPAGTRMAIVQLDSRLHLIQGFTSDPAELMNAVKAKRDSPEFSPVFVPGLSQRCRSTGAGGLFYIPGSSGSGDCDTTNAIVKHNIGRSKEILSQAIPQMMDYLRGYTGRKSVIWFSAQNIPAESLAITSKGLLDLDQTSSFVDNMNQTTDILALNQIALYLVDASVMREKDPTGSIMFAHADLQNAVKPGGGKLLFGNSIRDEIQRIAEGAWNYYTLSYTPSDLDFDGQFRALKIETNNPALHLQYRPGYYAASDYAKQMEHEREKAAQLLSSGRNGNAIDSAIPLGAPTPRDVLFKAHIDPALTASKGNRPVAKVVYADQQFRNSKYREYQISYNVKADSLHAIASPDGIYRGKLELVATVYDNLGNVINSVISKASIHASNRQYFDLLKNGVNLSQTIAIPDKNKLFLRLVVRDVTVNQTGALEVPVDEIKVGAEKKSPA
jgi:VWFA-related protein